jgi:L-alanine-DL-glutamate epimerase-like enolase superfamily enzyme
MIDLMRSGGPTEFLQIASAAAARRVPVSSHCFTEVSLHLVAALPGATFAEYLPRWWDGLFQERLRVERGKARLPEAPGLGLTFSPDVLKRFAS